MFITKRIKFFYEKHFKKKLFNKILLLNVVITLISVCAISTIILILLYQSSLQNEIYYNQKVIKNIDNYINEKVVFSENSLKQLYARNTLLSDLSLFLKSDFNEYSRRRIETYQHSISNTMDDFTEQIASTFNYDKDICNIIIYSKEKDFFYITSNAGMTKYCIYGDPANKLNVQTFGNQEYKSNYVFTGIKLPNEDRSTYGIMNAIKDPDIPENMGAMIINFNIDGIAKLHKKYENELKGYIVVLTSEGDVIYDSSNRYYGRKYPYTNMLSDISNGPQDLEKKSYINVINSYKGIIIAGIMPQEQISHSIKGVKIIVYIGAVILFFVFVMIMYLSLHIFSVRTRSIMDTMKEVQEGNLSARVPMSGDDDELKLIGQCFNEVCTRLEEYIEKVYVADLKQNNAKLLALQAQINPHFLYNTLEVIRMRAVSHGANDVAEMIYIMSMLFKNTIKKDTIVTISEEISHCKQYLELFHIRYNNKFTYEITVWEQILNYQIPKFTIQPLIENYIVHGIRLDQNNNIIKITGFIQDNSIIITVKDNGTGIPKEKLDEIQKRLMNIEDGSLNTIGLSNVNERLKILYGRQYGLGISSIFNEGTVIYIKIPVRKGEQ